MIYKKDYIIKILNLIKSVILTYFKIKKNISDTMFNLSGNRALSFIIILMLLTDIVVLFNVPFLRPVLTFIFLTFIPGMLILEILKINISNILKRIVLSVGLSVSFLMLLGLILNSFYPYILKPLSLYPLLISLNILVTLLIFAAYKVNGDRLNIENINLDLNFKSNLSSMVIFPILFPFMAILGTYLMNVQQNNVILLLLMFIIPLYIIILIYLRNKISNFTFPFSLWMIGLTLLLVHGLTSFNLIGRDVHQEFYCFQLTLENFHWNLFSYYDPYNACVSITILPTIYHVLLNISPEYVFKLVFALIGSIIPMITYFVFKKFIKRTYAFYASLFFIFQIFFIFLLGAVRQEFGFIFFFLAVMVYFDTEIRDIAKKIIFSIFIFSVLISHYTTAYIAITLMLLILITPFIENLVLKRKLTFINLDVILIILFLTFIWYIFAAQVQFESGASAVTATVSSGGNGGSSVASSSGGSSLLLAVFGIGLKSTANWISVIVNDLTFIFIGFGLLSITWKFKYYINKIGLQYLVGIYVSILLLVTVVLFPFASQLYGAERLFIQLLIFLAPVFVIGIISATKIIRIPRAKHVVILAILISLFVCNTNLHAHFLGTPYSPYFDNSGAARDEYFIHNEEIVAANWLSNYGLNKTKINSDLITKTRLGYANINSNSSFLLENVTPSGYLFLGYANVISGKMYKSDGELRNMDNTTAMNIDKYMHLFLGKSRIYDNGFSRIYY